MVSKASPDFPGLQSTEREKSLFCVQKEKTYMGVQKEKNLAL